MLHEIKWSQAKLSFHCRFVIAMRIAQETLKNITNKHYLFIGYIFDDSRNCIIQVIDSSVGQAATIVSVD